VTVRDRLLALEQFGIKLGLEQIRGLLAALNHPELTFPSLTIAGTNGKGSVTAMLERALRAAGYRTGRYTSPHLVHLEERFALNGEPISAWQLERAASRVLDGATTLPVPPSFFEATTAMALDVFREAKVDVAVLEVGLGGRLDATNAVDPIGAAITRVDFDHQQYLGHSLREIAAEKAGIIKRRSLVVVGDNPPEVLDVILTRAAAREATAIRATEGVEADVALEKGRTQLRLTTPVRGYGEMTLGLRGRHQAQNAVTAARLLESVDAAGLLRVSGDAIRSGLEGAEWPGRLEARSWQGTEVLLDGAHNASGARALTSYLREVYGRRVPMIIGVMRDKDVRSILETFAEVASHAVFTAASSPRAAAPHELEAEMRRCAPSLATESCDRPLDALTAAARFGAPVVVAGSLYLVGEIRDRLS
jgi:dihydrofolate synthase / folylpolyglutamate synthase